MSETEEVSLEARAIITHLLPRQDADIACRVLLVAYLSVIREAKHKRVHILSAQRMLAELEAELGMKGML